MLEKTIEWNRIRIKWGLFGKTVVIEGVDRGYMEVRTVRRALKRAFKLRQAASYISEDRLITLGSYVPWDCRVSAVGVHFGCCLVPWSVVDRLVMSQGWRMKYGPR